MQPFHARTEQQHSEPHGALLALRLASVFNFTLPVIVGDSTSALGALRRMSCSAAMVARQGLLQEIAWHVIESRIGYTLA